MLTIQQKATLLIRGAGIIGWNGAIIVDPRFDTEALKAQPALEKLIAELSKRVDSRCDFITLFINRPATLALGRKLANQLSKRWQRDVGILSISRHGREHAEFVYYHSTHDVHGEVLARLGSVGARNLFEGKTTILFTDLLRGEEHEGIIRALQSRIVRRRGVRVIGLVTPAVAELGARARLATAANNPAFKTFCLLHLRRDFEQVKKVPSTVKRQDHAGLLRGLRRLIGRT